MWDITMTRGDTYGFFVSMVQDDTGEPVPFDDGDLVIFTVRARQAFPGQSGNPVLIEKQITAFDGGEALITLLPADTNNLPPTNGNVYAYDVELRKPGGDVFTIITSSALTLGAEVTRYDQ